MRTNQWSFTKTFKSFFNLKGVYSKLSQKNLLENGLGADSTDNEKMMCLIVKLAINEFSEYEGLWTDIVRSTRDHLAGLIIQTFAF